MKLIVFLIFVIPLLHSCGNWATVTGESAREAIDLHETDLPDLPEKVVYKSIEEDQEEGKKE